MIEASVWIAPSIWKAVSDGIERSVAETIPTDSDCSSQERAADRRDRLAGLYRVVVSQLQRVQVEAIRVHLEQRDVGLRVEADDARGDLVAIGELDVDLLRLVDRCPPPLLSASVTTWAVVAISPSLEITKPDPSASDPPVPPSRVAPPPGRIERIVTTPGAAA